jgi:MFS transporter, PHS family, inorganic phosphate transporter
MIMVRLPSVHFPVGGASLTADTFRPDGRSVRRTQVNRQDAVAETQPPDLIAALDEASLSRFHLRAVLVSGMGFFTDAYDLFVIGIASSLISAQWHLSSGRLSLLNSTMLGAAFLGALVFGRFADVVGRKRVYWLVAVIMVAGAVGSALAPSYWVLIAFRFVLGFGVGGDYPVSAVMVSEYANRKDRGKLVGMVFGAQAVGLIVGPLVALALLGAGAGDNTAWRVMLGLGAIPAAAVVYLRSRMPESPRYQAQVRGQAAAATDQIARFSKGRITQGRVSQGGVSQGGVSQGRISAARSGGAGGIGGPNAPMGLRAFLTSRRYLIMLAGTAGTWFLLDYAYYGNTISTPQILGLISPHASVMTKIALQLAIFAVAAVPGYVLAIARLDHMGHRRLQLTGFALMAACFLIIGAVPGVTTMVAPFLLVYGVSYFFTEFGPNMTTFVMPSELYPVAMRATGHGISAGIGKLGAFVGVFLFPLLQSSLGLRGTLLLTAGISVAGFALTLVLPEPAGRSLDDVSGGVPAQDPRPQQAVSLRQAS